MDRTEIGKFDTINSAQNTANKTKIGRVRMFNQSNHD